MESRHALKRMRRKHCVDSRIDDCTREVMPIQYETYVGDRNDADRTAAARWLLAVAGSIGLVLLARWLSQSHKSTDEFGIPVTSEQATTVKASLEAVENGWIQWCASGHARLENNYAIRFEPAPGARGTEVHISGGGPNGVIREELRRFKQRLETGEIPASDGPGLSRAAQPQETGKVAAPTEAS
jgi:hypothetical protein